MTLDLDPDERLGTRLRPAWTAQWRRYVPGIGLALAGLAAGVATPGFLENLMILGLTELGARLLLASGLVVLAIVASHLADRPAVLTMLAGASSISLGANLTATRWMALPLVLAGLAWIVGLEIRRAASGLALTDRRVILPRPMRAAFGLSFDEIHVVHTTRDEGAWGSIILETEHGTVTTNGLPRHRELADRIEARIDGTPVAAEPQAVTEARTRVERLIERAAAR